MAINDKLNRIKEIKEDIKQALIDKGVEVTDEDSFGSYADKITNIPMEGGDPYYEELYNLRTSNGTNMSGLFAYAKGDSLDLTKMDVSKCTDMSYMFNNCTVNNVDITGWDLSKVNDVSYMFNYTYLENYKGLSNIVLPASLAYMLSSARVKQSKLDLSTWDTSNVTNLNSFFNIDDCEILDLSNWNTVNVTNMSSVFSLGYSNKLKELIIPTWDMTNTTSYNNLFGYSSNLNRIKVIDLSKSNDITITKILQSLPARTQTSYSDILVPVNTSQEVIDALIAKYWRPIGPSFDIESFQIISELDELLPGQKTKIVCHSQTPWYSSIPEVEFISSDDSIANVSENGEVTAVSLGSVEIYARLKDNPEVVSNAIKITVSEFDSTPYVIKFRGTKTPADSNYIRVNNESVKLTSMDYNSITDVYTYDVGEPITSIRFIGQAHTMYADTITELLKFDFNGNNITNMTDMFRYCSQLTELDLSTWDTSNVESINTLFMDCNALQYLDLTSWDTSNVNSKGNVFKNVPSTCQIYVGPNWTLTESECDFSGTFTRV